MAATTASPSIDIASSASYPSKLFYRIQEVSQITGLKPYVLRYWESEFSQLAPEKDKNDQRRYRRADIELVLRIKDLLYGQKFTIAGARQRLKAEGRPSRVVSGRRRSAAGPQASLASIRAEIMALMKVLKA